MSRKLRISTVRLICLAGFYLFVLLVYVASAHAQPGQGALAGAGQTPAQTLQNFTAAKTPRNEAAPD